MANIKNIIILIIVCLIISCKTNTLTFKNKESEKYFEEGQKHEQKKETKLALLYFNKADSAGPNTPAILETRGLLKCHSGDFRGGLADINKSILLETDSVLKKQIICNRGTEYFENKMLDSACADWKTAGKYDLGNYKKHCK